MNSKKGFTLIEILVVIAIIGILASIVLVNLGGFRAKGRDARRIADMRSIQNALELYYSANNCYPAALSALSTVGVTRVPKDPSTNADYQATYAESGDVASCGGATGGSKYVLGATLENYNDALKSDIDDGDVTKPAVTTAFCGTANNGAGTDERGYCVSL